MKEESRKSRFLIFLAALICLAIPFACFMQPHYSTDSYANLNSIEVAIHIKNGRVVTALVQSIFNRLGFIPLKHQTLTIAVAICVMALSVSLIYFEILPYLKQNHWTELLVFLSILLFYANVFFSEWLIYVESMTSTSIGLLMLTVSIILAGRKPNWKRLLASFLLLLAVLNMYQLYIEFYLTMSLIIIYARTGGLLNKDSLLHSLLITLIAAFACVLVILFQPMIPRLFGMAVADRQATFNLETLLANIKSIWKSQESILSNAGKLLPNGVFPATLISLFAILLWEHFRCGNLGNRLLYSLLAIIMITLLTYAPHIICTVVWLAPRTLVGIFHVPMYMAISIGISQSWVPEVNQRAAKLTIVIITLFLLVNAYSANGVLSNAIANNHIDQYCATLIQDRIMQYQEETGITVTKVGAVNDSSPVYYNPGVDYVNHDLNIRAMTVAWGWSNLLNFYCQTNYTIVAVPDDIYNTYFAGKNWNTLNLDEQAVFVDDTLYLAMY